MNKAIAMMLGAAAIVVWTGIARADNSITAKGPHGTVDGQSAAFVAAKGYPVLVCSPRQGGEAAAQCRVVWVKAAK